MGIVGYVGAQVEGAPNGRRHRGTILSFTFFGGLVLSLVTLGIIASYLGRLMTRWSMVFALGTAVVSLVAGLAAIFGPTLRRFVPDRHRYRPEYGEPLELPARRGRRAR